MQRMLRVTGDRPHILIVGGGLVGLTTAEYLQRTRSADEAAVTLVDPQNHMVYKSLLPEVASGMLEPTDVVVPLRRTLRGTRVIVGRLTGLDHTRDVATIAPLESGPHQVHYDHLVLALGSETKVQPVPGLAEHAVGFTTMPEALFLRDHVLSRLEVADGTDDERRRQRALTFVFVGGGYSGVEAIGELQSMAERACDLYPTVSPADQRWVLVEATDRILPMVDEPLAATAVDVLGARGVDVRLSTVIDSVDDGEVRLSDGDTLPTDTLVWAAGVAPNPLLADLRLPTAESGAVEVDATLRVRGLDNVWAAGDCAAVPDLVGGGMCPPSAQYALREARQLAGNLAAALRGQAPRPFRYDKLGEMLTLGRHDGIAQVRDRQLRGLLPWYLRRLYHVGRIPSVRRKLQVWTSWTLRLLLGGDVVSLGSLRRPRQPLELAAAAQADDQ